MEEVADEIPEVPEEIVEEVEDIVPEPPPLKRQSNPAQKKAAEKVTCEVCGKTMAASTYKYSHKCKPRAPDETVEEKPKKRVDRAKLAEALKDEKPSMTEKQSMRPMKNRAVINRTQYEQPEPPYQPNQQEIYSHLMHQRQQQAYMRHQAMLAPYQQMFAMRAQ